MAIRPERREVVIGTADELDGHRVRLEELNWLGAVARGRATTARSRSATGRGRSRPRWPAAEGGALDLVLEEPVRAITPGQSGVLYAADDRVLGGGVIGVTMRSLLLHWLLNAAALWVAAWLLPGLDFQGTIVQLLMVAAVFGLVNSLVRPILTVLTCPLIVVTLGLFTLVINALMLLLTGALVGAMGPRIHRVGVLGGVLRRARGGARERAAVPVPAPCPPRTEPQT